jgi:hypothetical protein
MANSNKTRQEIQELKDNWQSDPCWDIEDTEGFEQYKDELRLYRLDIEATWAAECHQQLLEFAERIGIPCNLKLAEYIERLEERVKELEERIGYYDARTAV